MDVLVEAPLLRIPLGSLCDFTVSTSKRAQVREPWHHELMSNNHEKKDGTIDCFKIALLHADRIPWRLEPTKVSVATHIRDCTGDNDSPKKWFSDK